MWRGCRNGRERPLAARRGFHTPGPPWDIWGRGSRQGWGRVMSGVGHNGGPSMEAGASWRRHCWRAAREALLPVLPVEVVRLRVRRAAALGLDYRTYAGCGRPAGEMWWRSSFPPTPCGWGPCGLRWPGGGGKAGAGGGGARGLAVAPLSAGVMAAANPVLDAVHDAPMRWPRGERCGRRSGRLWGSCRGTGWCWSATTRWRPNGARRASWRLCPGRAVFRRASC